MTSSSQHTNPDEMVFSSARVFLHYLDDWNENDPAYHIFLHNSEATFGDEKYVTKRSFLYFSTQSFEFTCNELENEYYKIFDLGVEKY